MSWGSMLPDPLEACTFGAPLGSRSVFILDPRLNFVIKRHKWKGKVQLNAQFSLCGLRNSKLLVTKSFIEKFNDVFFTAQRRFFHSMVKKITFYKLYMQVYMFHKRSINFVIYEKEKELQNASRFEMDFLLNFAMCSFDFIAFKD